MSASSKKLLVLAIAALSGFGLESTVAFPAMAQTAAPDEVAPEVVEAFAQTILDAAVSGDAVAAAAAIADVVARQNATCPNVDDALAVFEQVVFVLVDAAASNPDLRVVLTAAFELASRNIECPAIQAALANYATVIERAGPTQTIPQSASNN